MTRTKPKRLQFIDGQLCHLWAGPYAKPEHAEREIEHAFACGDFSHSDAPVVHQNAVYIRY